MPTSNQTTNDRVNGLWIGSHLSRLELLTIRSFCDHGMGFRLWVYDELDNDLSDIEGLELCDATEIIPREDVFQYRNSNTFGHGKGSYAGFSDIFRYKLLYEHGGWWVDMDICCLRPFDFDEAYVFRAHHELAMVGNVMKVPQGAELMKRCYDEAVCEVDAENTDWHKPIEILNRNVFDLGLERSIRDDLSLPDRWDVLRKLIRRRRPIPAEHFFVHWMNEEWRHRCIDKENVRFASTLGRLMQRHGVLPESYTMRDRIRNGFQHSALYRNLKLLEVLD